MSIRPFFSTLPLASRGALGSFRVEDVTLGRLLEALPTPLYATSLSAVEARARAYVQALGRNFQSGAVHYAMKANFAQPILRAALAAGAGIDIVSVGELRAALRAGVAAVDICFAGVGKSPAEWREALGVGIGSLNIEHASELGAILDFLAAREGTPPGAPCLSIRLNPCVELETHPHLKTGALDSKFGMLKEQALAFLRDRKESFASPEAYAHWVAPVRGIHVHVGSQLHDPAVFGAVAERVADFAHALSLVGVFVSHFDVGGGLGVGAAGVPEGNGDIDAHVDFVCGALRAALLNVAGKNRGLADAWGEGLARVSVALEPGRSVVASSTVLLTTVLYEKANADDVRFAYVDAGMNDFPRPSIYGAKHHVEWLASGTGAPALLRTGHAAGALLPWQVVGPVCESGDVLARDARLPPLAPGDVLGFFEAGAYCRSMASHYNLRPLPAEIFVRGNDIAHAYPAVCP